MEVILGSDQTSFETQSPTVRTPKSRSFSESASTAPNPLAPSPRFRERRDNSNAIASKDDHALLPSTPKASSSRRADFHARGLSLQMPPRLQMPSPSQFPRPAPLSPQLDQHNIYVQQSQSISGSPATSLPRHSRGLDFSRACTNLHHSTLAEQRSEDSSPVVTQKGWTIPTRRTSMGSMMLESPQLHGWGSVPERSAISSSLGSVNMLGSESESSDSDGDASMGGGDENDDAIFTTPHVQKMQNPNVATTPFGMPTTPGANNWLGANIFSPAQASLMKAVRRSSKVQKSGKKSARKTRKGSSSASNSGYSSMASPRAGSPPAMRSIETAAGGGYFTWSTAARSRRESLALGTDGLNLSSGNDSGDEASQSNTPSTPGVVRRAVTRRGNLLPKTKGFARIRAALAEEATPIDTEVRREAETIRQVRDRDGSISEFDLAPDGRTVTAQSSPNLLPAVPECAQEDFGRDLDESAKGLGMNFAAAASRNSGGLDYWSRFDPSTRTPPPPSFRNGIMSDTSMDSDNSMPFWRRPRAQSSTSDASDALAPINTASQPSAMNDDVHLKNFKRRREDDHDLAMIKRRAVSPGMSAQNSPILAHSPSYRDSWGQPPESRSGRKDSLPPPLTLSAASDVAQSSQTLQALQHSNKSPPSLPSSSSTVSQQTNTRHGSAGSSVSLASGSTAATPVAGSLPNSATGKKLGLQGMLDTNDGLMKMTIE